MNGRAMSIIIVPEKEAWKIVSPLLITHHIIIILIATQLFAINSLRLLCLICACHHRIVVAVVVLLSFALNLA